MLLQLFGSLPQLPPVPQLRYTVCMVLAGYADWISETTAPGKANDLMPSMLQMLTTGLLRMPSAGIHLMSGCLSSRAKIPSLGLFPNIC